MAWKVRYINYSIQFKNMEREIMDTVHTVLSNGDLMMRQQLRDFEEHLAAFVGTKYAIGVSNCTDALQLAIRAAGIGAGDEVITVAHTFIATAAAIHHAGATPVLVDIADDDLIDISQIEKGITPRTKAIIPVQLNGRVADMDALMAIAQKHNLIVIEDSAQALGGSFKGKGAGSFGLAGCFSFYPAKLLGAFGDAGAVTTNDEPFAQKIRMMRDHGRTPEGDIFDWSFNCRLDNLQAALLDLKLARLPEGLRRRREIAAIYHRELSSLKQLLLPVPPVEKGDHYDVFQNYEIEAENRDGLVAHLKENGVEILLPWGGKGVHHFPRLGLTHSRLPRTDLLFRRALMVPMYPELTDDEVLYVCQVVKGFYEGTSAPAVREALSAHGH